MLGGCHDHVENNDLFGSEDFGKQSMSQGSQLVRSIKGRREAIQCRQYRTVRLVIKPRKRKRRGWIKYVVGTVIFSNWQPQEYAGKILTYSGFQEKSYVGVAPFKLNAPTGRLVQDSCLIMRLTFVVQKF